MVSKEKIIEAYSFLRQHNQSIPDETLDFMKEESLKALDLQKCNSQIVNNIDQHIVKKSVLIKGEEYKVYNVKLMLSPEEDGDFINVWYHDLNHL